MQLPGFEGKRHRAADGLSHVAVALLTGGKVVTEQARLGGPALHLGQVDVAEQSDRRLTREKETTEGFAGRARTPTCSSQVAGSTKSGANTVENGRRWARFSV